MIATASKELLSSPTTCKSCFLASFNTLLANLVSTQLSASSATSSILLHLLVSQSLLLLFSWLTLFFVYFLELFSLWLPAYFELLISYDTYDSQYDIHRLFLQMENTPQAFWHHTLLLLQNNHKSDNFILLASPSFPINPLWLTLMRCRKEATFWIGADQ